MNSRLYHPSLRAKQSNPGRKKRSGLLPPSPSGLWRTSRRFAPRNDDSEIMLRGFQSRELLRCLRTLQAHRQELRSVHGAAGSAVLNLVTAGGAVGNDEGRAISFANS